MVTATALLACRQVEKVKKQFGGHEIVGKTLGVIGLGNIGAAVAESGQSTHVDVPADTSIARSGAPASPALARVTKALAQQAGPPHDYSVLTHTTFKTLM